MAEWKGRSEREKSKTIVKKRKGEWRGLSEMLRGSLSLSFILLPFFIVYCSDRCCFLKSECKCPISAPLFFVLSLHIDYLSTFFHCLILSLSHTLYSLYVLVWKLNYTPTHTHAHSHTQTHWNNCLLRVCGRELQCVAGSCSVGQSELIISFQKEPKQYISGRNNGNPPTVHIKLDKLSAGTTVISQFIFP